jgi:hypothetical protein
MPVFQVRAEAIVAVNSDREHHQTRKREGEKVGVRNTKEIQGLQYGDSEHWRQSRSPSKRIVRLSVDFVHANDVPRQGTPFRMCISSGE